MRYKVEQCPANSQEKDVFIINDLGTEECIFCGNRGN